MKTKSRAPRQTKTVRLRKRMDAALTELRHAELVRAATFDDAEYIFKHALVQDTALSTLLRGEYKRLNLLVAQAYEKIFPAQAENEYAAILAQHYDAAGDDAKTVQYATRAGDLAARMYANAEAVEFYTHALDHAQNISHANSQLRELFIRRGRLYELRGNHNAALANYDEMQQVARARNDRALELAALMARATIYSTPTMRFDPAQARSLSETALALARTLPDRAARRYRNTTRRKRASRVLLRARARNFRIHRRACAARVPRVLFEFAQRARSDELIRRIPMPQPFSTHLQSILNASMPLFRFATSPLYSDNAGKPNVSDFAFGNPHDMPVAGFADALQKWSVPQNKDWYAYKRSEPEAQHVVAQSLRAWRGVNFDPNDIFLTTGAFAALTVALGAILDAGDEVIFISPPWFFYEPMILSHRAQPVRVRVNAQTFDLDLEAIDAAITEKTRAIIVNSPNNPTGKIYSEETLRALAEILEKHSARNGRDIYLLSDEAYSRIIYDARAFPSPTSFYPYSFLIYTYGKTLLTPGQRIGYLALPPNMPQETRQALNPAIFVSQLVTGYAFPNALLQHALGDLEKLSIDMEHLQYKRDWLVRELQAMGYAVHSPEGTFYLLPRSPIESDWMFAEKLAAQQVLVLPGEIVEMPGYFRISLTANDAMIERALEGFKAAIQTM